MVPQSCCLLKSQRCLVQTSTLEFVDVEVKINSFNCWKPLPSKVGGNQQPSPYGKVQRPSKGYYKRNTYRNNRVEYTKVEMGSNLITVTEIKLKIWSHLYRNIKLRNLDKLYIMLPEFGKDYDKDKARADYIEYKKAAKEEYTQAEEEFLKQLDNASLYDLDVNENEVKLAPKTFKKWWRENKANYFTGFHKIEFNPEGDIFEQSRAARNNYLIDLMWGVLTNKDTVPQILNPGGFPTIVNVGKIYSILASNTEKEIVEGLKSIGKTVKGSVEETLFSLSDKEVKTLSQGLGEQLDPLSPLTQVILQQRNMAGANMIGVYATHNSHHALVQLTNLAFSPSITDSRGKTISVNVVINGNKSLINQEQYFLGGIKNAHGQYISKNCAEFLASSVDNAKNPSLDLLNQNEFTVNASMLLIRMGYTIQEVGMFIQQPIIVEMTKRYMRERALGGYVNSSDIINNVLKEYKAKSLYFNKFDYKTWTCPLSDLAMDIRLQKEAVNDPSQTSNPDLLKYYGRQVAVGYMFKALYKGGEDLRTVMDATKQDTVAGAAGPTIPDTMAKIFKIRTLKSEMQKKNWTLSGADIIEQELVNYDGTKQEMLDFFMHLALPYIEAFDQLGIAVSKRLFERYFPHYRQDLQDLVFRMTKFNKRGSLSAKTVKSIFSDYFAYALSEIGFFHGEAQRNAFINEFPDDFEEIVNSNPDIAEIPFIQMFIKVSKSKRNSIPTLKFRRVGQLTSSKKTKFMQEWENMLRMDNPKCRELALNLFKYAYYRNGFEFGPNTFIHLASVTLKQAIPGYIEKLRTLTEQSGDLNIFLEQYIRNHLDNTQLVHPVKSDTLEGMPIYTEDGNLKDSFAIDFGVENFPLNTYKALHINKGSHYPYIAITGEGETAYYAAYASLDKESVIEYRKIDRLGVPNEFLEYDSNNPDIKSVIGRKDLEAWEAENIKKVDSGLNEAQIDYSSMPMDDAFEGYNVVDTPQITKPQTPTVQTTSSKVEIHSGYWTRAEVEKATDKVFLFGDNTEDRTVTHYVPSLTQAVIRGLPNAIGIDTKKDRRTSESSYFTDADFEQFKEQVDEAIQRAINSGKTIVLPADSIGTGKAQLKERAPKLFAYLQEQLGKLSTPAKVEVNNIETASMPVFTDDEIPLSAYAEVYGEMPEGYSNSEGARLMDIPNTEEVRDADGQKACKN